VTKSPAWATDRQKKAASSACVNAVSISSVGDIGRQKKATSSACVKVVSISSSEVIFGKACRLCLADPVGIYLLLPYLCCVAVFWR